MPEAESHADPELDHKTRELLRVISNEHVSPKILELAQQLQTLLDHQAGRAHKNS